VKLLPVDDARAAMLAAVAPLSAETVPIAEANGRVLAEDVVAVRDQPPFAASAMDGWAVRGAGMATTRPSVRKRSPHTDERLPAFAVLRPCPDNIGRYLTNSVRITTLLFSTIPRFGSQ